ncbi:unnamed protein product, partial [Rotaria magnacalcarata]
MPTIGLIGTMQPRCLMYEKYLTIWLDENMNLTNDDYKYLLMQLQTATNDVCILKQCDDLIHSLKETKAQKICLVLSDTINESVITSIHDLPHLHSIHVFSKEVHDQNDWRKKWTKIKEAYTDIGKICQALKLINKQFNQDNISTSIINMNEDGSSKNLDQLDPSFMYTGLLKEILLEIEYKKNDITEFARFWHAEYIGNKSIEENIAEFEHAYSPESSIVWYTKGGFISDKLNLYLRTMDVEAIMKMSFFLCDLHRQIQKSYSEHINFNGTEVSVVYRGQGLSTYDFNKLIKGGLISFNNFLSTSTNKDVAYLFMESSLGNPGTVGILFKILIGSTISSTPFIYIGERSDYNQEEEILFTMHSVFRIDKIKKYDSDDRLYEVTLIPTTGDDKQLRELTDIVRKEVSGSTGWHRLARLLSKIN